MRVAEASKGVTQAGGACLRTTVHVTQTLRRAAAAAVEHDALNVAQATAYSAMFALFPALIVAAALVSLLPDSAPFRSQMSFFFGRVLPSNVSPLLEVYFVQSGHTQHAGTALLGSIVVSLTGATSVMATLMEGFRRAYKLPLLRKSFWPMRWRALMLVPLSLLPMTAASALVVFGHIMTRWLAGLVAPELQPTVFVVAFLVRWTVALAGSVGLIAVIYHLGTDMTRGMREYFEPLVSDVLTNGPLQLLRRDWSWSASLPGAMVATVLWFVSTLVFGIYVTRFANYSRVYGSLGAAIALMSWLYLIALSILIGAEFNAQRAVEQRDPALSELLWKLPGRLWRWDR
ncbi:YihY/virulence factor BrkB family protein [Granulicella paludicola]|uniref:YihY/virulence factor BrkB family protein n=1 Tax=Granulicella paludicola TaxID=474951 RepID=UPI0021E06F4A|nr:YihY/virulence factor BrkB family protein [Granulicella paludicola]